MLKGIDISEHNGAIDPRYYDHDFVMIRAGWSDTVDKLFERHVKTCEQYGIPYGVYWYSYALTPSSAKEEAEACLKAISGKKISVGVWFDMEDADSWKARNGWDRSKTNVSNICNEFCSIIENAGYYAGIYASLSWLTGSGQLIDCPAYDKWVAHWADPIPDHSNLGTILQYADKPVDMDLIYADNLSRYKPKEKTMKTFKEFYQKYLGKVIDDDGAYGAQCVDGFRVFCREFGVPVHPTPNNYADGYWYSRDALGYGKYFDYITNGKYQDGDVVIWARGSKSHPSSHIAFWYHGEEFGENQGGNRGFCLKATDFSDALGALRLKAWNVRPVTGWSKKNGRWYYLRNGELLTGWQKLKWSGGYDWFWFKDSGVMVTGLHWLEWKGVSQWYYFKTSGAMAKDENIMMTLHFGKSGKLTGESTL